MSPLSSTVPPLTLIEICHADYLGFCYWLLQARFGRRRVRQNPLGFGKKISSI